jgi:hypothetical protein
MKWAVLREEIIKKEKSKSILYFRNRILEKYLSEVKWIIKMTVEDEVRKAVEINKEVIMKNWQSLTSKMVEKLKYDVKIKVGARNLWNEVIKSAGEKMKTHIKKELEKEEVRKRKQKLKRLRHKWRGLLMKAMIQKKKKLLKLAEEREILITNWKKFEDVKKDIDKTIKIKLEDWYVGVLKRKNRMNEHLNKCTISIKEKIDEQVKLLERNEFF